MLELPVEDLLDELGRPDGRLASGPVAALVAAMAAEIVAAAAARSERHWDEARGAAVQAHVLRLRAAPLASSDARAFAEATELLQGRAGGATPEYRDFALGRALSRAAEVPLLIAQIAADVAALAKDVAEHGAPEVRGDAAGAAVLAHAAAKAAAHLVEINLATTSDDLRVMSARSIAAAAGAWAEAAVALE
ncbi:MAG TPA: cyclodeaminase/cyclohydrolase family protein [Gaiellaceae bacterium]|nr:cyclodeaminase/cyclohydrolase family protein [Gaiellaceae bacterium]